MNTLIKTLTDYIHQRDSDMDATIIPILIDAEVPHFTTTEQLGMADFGQEYFDHLGDCNSTTDKPYTDRIELVISNLTLATGIAYE